MKSYSLRKIAGIASSLILALMLSSGFCSCQEANKKSYVDSSLLWEISGNGLSKPSYLFGTIHFYDTAVFKIPQAVYAAIDESDCLALELDFDNINPMQMMQAAIVNDPDSTLDKLVSENTLKKINENMVVQSLIAQLGDKFYNFKPFFVSSFLYIDDISKPVTGVDTDLHRYAKEKEKTTIGIETVDEQLALINSMPLKDQAKMLDDAFNEYDSMNEAKQVLYKAYKAQDFAVIIAEMEKGGADPLLADKLITKRNQIMAERIDELIKPNSQNLFAGVGALHLPDIGSTKGVVSLLKEMGYELRAIKLDF